MKRLFAAIKITPDPVFMNQIHLLQKSLGHERLKWVEDHNIHVTLKFFGETPEKKIPEIQNILQSVAGKTGIFELSIKKLGIFGSSYNPRVIWVGIEPYHSLVFLMKQVQEELRTIGYEPDRQNLVPHLTIGRIRFLKDTQLFQNTVDIYRDMQSLPFVVGDFHLYESILKKEGPTYLVIRTFKLAG
jgi:RNA 2',3'-cyclic 3'-phosphodiesterase